MIKDTLNEAPAPFRGTDIHTLSNGLRLILKEDRTVPAVSLHAWARCGSVNETPDIAGISHGLEHMVFKGTPTRSAGEISRTIESNGGAMNAATQLETTHYFIDVPAYSADTALDVLADTILNPLFPQEELEREKLVILEEIHRRNDSPDATLWDTFFENLFKNSPYGVKTIGTKETVSAFTPERLKTYFQTHYVPSNMTFVAAGDFDKGAVLKSLIQRFDGWRGNSSPGAPPVSLDNWKGGDISLKRPVQMTYIAAGFPAEGLDGKDMVALDILSDILGGCASSRLVQKLREETRSVLAVSCDYIPFRQKGVFGFFIDTVKEKADKALGLLQSEMKRLLSQPVQSQELDRAKARTKSDWLMSSESPRGQAATLGSLASLGHLDLVTQYLPRVEVLTTEDLNAVARKYFENPALSITTIRPES